MSATTTEGSPEDTTSPALTFTVVTRPSTGEVRTHLSRVVSICFRAAQAWSTPAWAWAICSGVAPFLASESLLREISRLERELSRAALAEARAAFCPSTEDWDTAPAGTSAKVLS